jgi:protein-S-isoprenylcysteine O-methyltransferase Ste14
MAAVPGGARLDLGKLVMVPAEAAILLLDLRVLVRADGHGGTLGVLQWLGSALTAAFYLLIIWCYLRRGPAVATSRSITAHAAAVTATWAPFVFPLLHRSPPGLGQQGASDLLLVAGTAWSLWSLRFLGRNLSVIAQARDVVDRGPYRWVRHPLYLGEIVSALGLAVAANNLWALGVWLGLCALQAYRALREEQILLRALPGYAGYRRRTAALLPGLF